ncbi:PEGA domain-containing protein [Aestuariibaculum lutulentum]|uniref:PEGA domain-containing protein n=1 Tax=Aestuariibaculum lutulentum TaxID=2920935 RepID=A0ABS9RH07_9FLAO|nr:PEGA domain-containing protein [Aestuariibaculum lutulentum]MCH4552218.1 PEGA domain-containing protein [Aestuariibaculum lutulentum]
MKKATIALGFASLVLTTSCASIFTGSKRTVLFESNPSGAKIYVNGFEKGITPAQIKVKADDRVDFRIDNYKERVVVMDSKFNLVSILNGFSIIGWGVDAITGSLKRVDTKYVKVDLEEQTKSIAVENYLKNGKIDKVNIDTENKIVETVIVLND